MCSSLLLSARSSLPSSSSSSSTSTSSMMFISHFSIYLPCLSQLEREINLVVRRQTRWLSNEVVYDAAAALSVHITVISCACTHPYVQMNQLNDQDRVDGQVSQLSFVKENKHVFVVSIEHFRTNDFARS